jgi:hypothetical protein
MVLLGCGDTTGDRADDAAPGDGSTSSAPASSSATDLPTTSASPTTPAVPDWPDCAVVWVDGSRLPGGYKGCLDGAQAVKAHKQFCEFGKPLVTYANRFWAVPGGPVHEAADTLAKDPSWKHALRQCGG